ncbi:hypothetical protein DMUE_2770 [Dictyocoela muelleri]|nr:hypothetical protein DMUE_2770 [Dictyocoela muelleri]
MLLNFEKNMVLSEKQHIHEEDPIEVEQLIFKNALYNKARESNEVFNDVLSSALSLTKTQTGNLGNINNYKDHFNLIKNKKIIPVNTDSVIDSSSCMTLDGNNFLRLDTGPTTKNRVLIFVSDFFIEIMKKSEIIMADSTFKISPLEILSTAYYTCRIL